MASTQFFSNLTQSIDRLAKQSRVYHQVSQLDRCYYYLFKSSHFPAIHSDAFL